MSLNPVEGLWSCLKAVELADLCGPSMAEVIAQAHRGVERVRRTPHLAYAFLRLDSDHPMHHPFHLRGAGPLPVLAREGVPEPNLVWKDTVLVRTATSPSICRAT